MSIGDSSNLELLWMPLTIAVNVDRTGITLSVVVSVSLVSVGLVNAVVTGITNIIPVSIILGRVVNSRAVVLK